MAQPIISKQSNRENAFQVWYAHGRNDSETVRELKKQGFSVTRQTIADWKTKYSWAERADNLDLKKHSAADTALTFEETLLQDLQTQKGRYDLYFDGLVSGKVDNQAMYVYSQLCRQILDLSKKIKPKQAREKKGMTAQTAEDIKRDILGINASVDINHGESE